jgi:hypothetical protein
MNVAGHYVKKFSEASHVLFNGHLDDPSFREIAIQRLVSVGAKTIQASESGVLDIICGRKGKGEYVKAQYRCPVFGSVTTEGFPFKDNNTEALADKQEELF